MPQFGNQFSSNSMSEEEKSNLEAALNASRMDQNPQNLERRKTEYIVQQSLRRQQDEEEQKKQLLRRLEEKVKAKLQEKILQERSLVEDHVRKMERFGGKNKIANEKVELIKARDQEVLSQTAKIEARFQ